MPTSPTRPLPPSFFSGPTAEPIERSTIAGVIGAAASIHGSAPALTAIADAGVRRWSFEELEACTAAIGSAVARRWPPGSRLGVLAGNVPEWLLLAYGCARANVTVVTLNPALTTHELDHCLRVAKVQAVFAQRDFRGRPSLDLVTDMVGSLPHLAEAFDIASWVGEASDAVVSLDPPEVDPGDMAQIQFTSGTSGRPKGACLSHSGLVNNARLFGQANRLGPNDVFWNPMPLFHTAGFGLASLGALQAGCEQLLPEGFEADRGLEAIEGHRATATLCVPTMLSRLVAAQGSHARDATSLRSIMLGGAVVPRSLAEDAERAFGAVVTIGYGQTEASPYLTHTLPDEPDELRHGTVGRPLPHTRLKIIDATGATVPLGEVGEVCARSYGVMSGYVGDEEATSGAFTADGYLRTGDLGRFLASGHLVIEGRLRDMIIRGGENVYAREVEQAIATHPEVEAVAVVGVPDDDLGEVVAAAVQLRSGASASSTDLARHCRVLLAPFKTPSLWSFPAQLPMTASGKIQKFAVRSSFESGTSGEPANPTRIDGPPSDRDDAHPEGGAE